MQPMRRQICEEMGVMCGNHGDALCSLAFEQSAHPRDAGAILRAGGLVELHELRCSSEGTGDCQPLALPTREAQRMSLGHPAEPRQLEQLVDLRSIGVSSPVMAECLRQFGTHRAPQQEIGSSLAGHANAG